MAGFLGMIGTLPFVCSHEKVMTFSNLQTEQSVRYATHEVIGKKPVLEFIGESLSRVSFQIRLIRLGLSSQHWFTGSENNDEGWDS